MLALAELTVLTASPERLLFGYTPGSPPDQLCSGVGAATLWCIGKSQSHDAAQVIAIMILSAVAAGLWPRWLYVPHWYVAFSVATRLVVPDGGDEVAQILTLLLIPICLGDDRWCHWTRPSRPMSPVWHGSAFAATLLLRCQVAIIYFDAALSKLAFPAWRSGRAVPILLNDPQFGLPPELRGLIERFLVPAPMSAAITWTVLAIELSVGASMLLGIRARRVGFVLGVCLHAAIMAAMGLFSFGLIMISLLTVVSSGGFSKSRTGGPATRERVITVDGAGSRAVPPGRGDRTRVHRVLRARACRVHSRIPG
jgi:antimicrobial peptide system SdpB family protein